VSDIYQLFDSAAASGLSSSEQVGYIGRPKTVGRSVVSLEKGDWTYTWNGQYVSTTRNKDLSNVYTYQGYEGATRDIKAGWQFLNNVSVGYDQDHWGVLVGVRNVFDTKPNLISTSAGTVVGNAPLYASQYDWYGRTFFARFNYKF
jgi:iron complex outermembrane receptor protein